MLHRRPLEHLRLLRAGARMLGEGIQHLKDVGEFLRVVGGARRGNPEQNPTLRGRRLAMELQRRREATGMSREEVACQLEWSTSTIFRIETGRSRPQPGNVRTLLELYGVTGAERDGLIQLTREARQPGWWHSFRDVLPNPYEVYIGLEAGAASIRNFEPNKCSPSPKSVAVDHRSVHR